MLPGSSSWEAPSPRPAATRTRHASRRGTAPPGAHWAGRRSRTEPSSRSPITPARSTRAARSLNAGGNPDADFLAVWDGAAGRRSAMRPGRPSEAASPLSRSSATPSTSVGRSGNGAGIAAADYLLACDLTTGASRSTVAKDGDFNGCGVRPDGRQQRDPVRGRDLHQPGRDPRGRPRRRLRRHLARDGLESGTERRSRRLHRPRASPPTEPTSTSAPTRRTSQGSRPRTTW